ncbi:MAG: class I SAM-dependent methyltransferase [Patescibacteria group bacterium]
MSTRKGFWDTKENAEAYDNYARNFPMYQETSADLVEIVDLKSGMTVIDLAAGTGATSQAILAKIGDQGRVIAVDQAKEMLKKAQEKFASKNVQFVVAEAENLDQVITEPVDVVVCNSAFWQMKAPETLRAVANVLKPDGIFAFNLPDQFFDNPSSDNLDSLGTLGQKADLKLESRTTKRYQKSPAEKLAFQEIPIMQRNFRDEDERAQFMAKLKDKAEQNIPQEQQWIYFVFRKD